MSFPTHLTKINNMVILGIDPGTSIVGYGAVSEESGKIVCLDYGAIKVKEVSQADRLLAIEKSLNRLLKKFKPDLVVLEKIFFFKNQKTAFSVAEARGVITLVTRKNRVELIELTPLELKRYFTGYGRASKEGVQKMLKLILNLKELPKPDDAADALALAILGSGRRKG